MRKIKVNAIKGRNLTTGEEFDIGLLSGVQMADNSEGGVDITVNGVTRNIAKQSDFNIPITFTVDSKFTLTGFKGVISGKIASVQITVTAKEQVTASWSGIGNVSIPPKVAVVGSTLNLSNVTRTPYMRINENGQTQFLFYSGISIEVGDQLMFSCTYAID